MEYTSFELLKEHNNILPSSIIVWSSETKYFSIFKNVDKYLDYKNSESESYWNEVILPDRPHKFFIDLDYTAPNTVENTKTFQKVVAICKESIKDGFEKKYSMLVLNEEIATVYSNGISNNKYKFSANVILPFHALYQSEHKKIGNIISEIFDEYLEENGINIPDTVFDKNQINKSGRYNNRLPGCSKFGEEERPKTFKEFLFKESQLILTNCNNNEVQIVGSQKDIPEASKFGSLLKPKLISDKNIKYVASLFEKHWKKHFEYRDNNGSMINFNRISPSYCSLCERRHEKDNTFYISINENTAYAKCFRISNKCYDVQDISEICETKNDNLEDLEDSEIPKKTRKNIQLCSHIFNEFGMCKHCLDNSNDKIANITNSITPNNKMINKIRKKTNNRFPNVDLEEETSNIINFKMAFPDNYKLVLIKAAMKMGKTQHCINKIKNAQLKNPEIRVLLISFRRTFSSESKKNFPDFSQYTDIKETNINLSEYPKLIIQLESINRINLLDANNTKKSDFPVDIVILDEIESIWTQFSSSTFRDFQGCANTFTWLLKNAKQVIGMDANISSRTIRIFSHLFPHNRQHLYINKYNPSKNIDYYWTTEDITWMDQLRSDIKENKNIMIFTNSFKSAKCAKQFCLELKVLECNIKLYSSETLESEKRKHFSDVNQYWSEYQVVICTPTVTAGVSFTKKHFHSVYGYFTNISCDVYTCQQMIGRVREIIDKKIFIYYNHVPISGFSKETNLDKIEENMKINRSEVVKELSESIGNIGSVNYEIQPDASIRYYDSFVYRVIIENIKKRNESINQFEDIYINTLIEQENHIYDKYPNEKDESDEGYDKFQESLDETKSISDTTKGKVQESTIKSYENASLINSEKFNWIKQKRRNNEDVVQQEIDEYKKYQMCGTLSIGDGKIHNRVILKFYGKNYELIKVKNVKELFEIHPFNWDDAIKNIRNKEIEFLKRQYNNSNMINYAKYKFRSDIHKRIKECIEKMKFQNDSQVDIKKILLGQLGKNGSIKYRNMIPQELADFEQIVNQNMPIINESAIKVNICAKIKPNSDNPTSRATNFAFEILADILESFYCVSKSKKGFNILINAYPELIFELENNKYYRDGKKISSNKTILSKFPIINTY